MTKKSDDTVRASGQAQRRMRGFLVGGLFLLAPTTAMAAGAGGEHHFPWAAYAASWVNFAIFFAILWKFALPPIQAYFAKRREELQANLNEAKLLREEAAAMLAEYESRLDALDAEREALLVEYREQGEREKERIIEDATRQVAKLRVDAERVIEQEVKKAKAALEARAVEQALTIARERVEQKLATGGQDKLVHRYIEDLKKIDAQQRA